MATCLILSFGASAQDRIVSVGGDVTEIIYALGEGDRIAATDSTSVYPLKALATPKVGYVRNLSAEGVLSVEPDLILISGAAGPAD
ncbi:MAG: ABC transporter substrate-binding protein, partial [Pseudomonadota bacterium]